MQRPAASSAARLQALEAHIVVHSRPEPHAGAEAANWSPNRAERILMFATILQQEIAQRYGVEWPIDKDCCSSAAMSRIELGIDREGKCGTDGYALQVDPRPCPYDPEDAAASTVSIVLTAASETAMLTAIYRFIRDLRYIQGRLYFPAEARRITVSAVNSARRWSRDRHQHRGGPVPGALVL